MSKIPYQLDNLSVTFTNFIWTKLCKLNFLKLGLHLHLLLYLYWQFGGNLNLFLWNVSLKNCVNWTFWTWFQCFEAVLYRSKCTMLMNLICRYLLTHAYMQIENFFCNTAHLPTPPILNDFATWR